MSLELIRPILRCAAELGFESAFSLFVCMLVAMGFMLASDSVWELVARTAGVGREM